MRWRTLPLGPLELPRVTGDCSPLHRRRQSLGPRSVSRPEVSGGCCRGAGLMPHISSTSDFGVTRKESGNRQGADKCSLTTPACPGLSLYSAGRCQCEQWVQMQSRTVEVAPAVTAAPRAWVRSGSASAPGRAAPLPALLPSSPKGPQQSSRKKPKTQSRLQETRWGVQALWGSPAQPRDHPVSHPSIWVQWLPCRETQARAEIPW